MAPIHILVVDDEPLALELVRVWLEGEGYRVSTRSDALGTTSFVLRSNPDVVILDVEMPGMNGHQLARILRYHPETAHIRTILHSSTGLERLRRLARQSGASAVVKKGGDREAFLATVRTVVTEVEGTRPTANAS